MIKNLEITGVHTELDQDIIKYVRRKIGQLDKYISRRARQPLRVDVILREAEVKNQNRCACEVIIHLPKDRITVSETTINLYAAVDIVESKLKMQLKKYKELHNDPKFYRHLFRRYKNTKNGSV